MSILKADLNAAELRVAALLAHDAPWLAAFAAGESPHDQNAQALFGYPVGKDSDERKFAKAFVFRYIYTPPDKPPSMDPGALRLSKVALAPSMLQVFGEKLNASHAMLMLWKQTQLANLHATGIVSNAYGRFRDLRWALATGDKRWEEHAESIALNHPIQTLIGDWMDECLIRVYISLQRSGLWANVIAQRHDELVVECHENQVPGVARELRAAIEQPISVLDNAVIPCEITAGPTWGEQREIVL